MKMKTRLRNAEKRVVAIEVVIIIAACILTVHGVKEIIDGSLWAVMWSPLTALCGCVAGDDVKRIIGEAKRRDGNG